jgi:hypothetical protein
VEALLLEEKEEKNEDIVEMKKERSWLKNKSKMGWKPERSSFSKSDKVGGVREMLRGRGELCSIEA